MKHAPLNFPAISLTALTKSDLYALTALTKRWSPPPPLGATTTTLGPAGYRRRRVLSVVVVFTLMSFASTILLSVTALFIAQFTDRPMLGALPSALAISLVPGLLIAVVGWYLIGGKRRNNISTEPETRLTFTATSTDLTVADSTGNRLSGCWARWRIAQIRLEHHGENTDFPYTFDAVTLVRLADDGTSAGSFALAPETLANGHRFAATVIGMIANNALRAPR